MEIHFAPMKIVFAQPAKDLARTTVHFARQTEDLARPKTDSASGAISSAQLSTDSASGEERFRRPTGRFRSSTEASAPMKMYSAQAPGSSATLHGHCVLVDSNAILQFNSLTNDYRMNRQLANNSRQSVILSVVEGCKQSAVPYVPIVVQEKQLD